MSLLGPVAAQGMLDATPFAASKWSIENRSLDLAAAFCPGAYRNAAVTPSGCYHPNVAGCPAVLLMEICILTHQCNGFALLCSTQQGRKNTASAFLGGTKREASVPSALLQDRTCGLKGAASRSSVSATLGSSPGLQQRRQRPASSCRRCVVVQMRLQMLVGR